MAAPCSSYSSFVIHSWWKVPSEARTEPPSHEEYFLSKGIVGLWILIFCYRSE
jgi:hypothetical protein